MKFVIASAFYSGLGFAVRLQEEGHDVLLATGLPDDRRRADQHAIVGNGVVPKRPLREVIDQRSRYRDWIFVWDENHSVPENELLRSEGFRVLGGGKYADSMEHDRDACVALMERHGLQSPPSYAFHRVEDALRFLDEHKGAAFVFKPDRGETYETWLPHAEDPDEATEELRHHLRSTSTESFLLQERKAGIEIDVEVWFVRGEPRFSFMTLEVKRRLTGDLGDMSGCALDFAFTIPLESRAVQETVGRLFPVYRDMCYTGFGDANVTIARDGVWFFEKCERFGYNAHPNLFWNLNRAPLGETFAGLLDGSFEPDFAEGFGASCTIYMDHPAAGKVIHFPEQMGRDLYWMDIYKEGPAILTAGYNELVAIANGFGYTMAEAWEKCVARAWQVKFPGRAFRTDGAATNYPSSPVRRYEALKVMGYI